MRFVAAGVLLVLSVHAVVPGTEVDISKRGLGTPIKAMNLPIRTRLFSKRGDDDDDDDREKEKKKREEEKEKEEKKRKEEEKREEEKKEKEEKEKKKREEEKDEKKLEEEKKKQEKDAKPVTVTLVAPAPSETQVAAQNAKSSVEDKSDSSSKTGMEEKTSEPAAKPESSNFSWIGGLLGGAVVVGATGTIIYKKTQSRRIVTTRDAPSLIDMSQPSLPPSSGPNLPAEIPASYRYASKLEYLEEGVNEQQYQMQHGYSSSPMPQPSYGRQYDHRAGPQGDYHPNPNQYYAHQAPHPGYPAPDAHYPRYQ